MDVMYGSCNFDRASNEKVSVKIWTFVLIFSACRIEMIQTKFEYFRIFSDLHFGVKCSTFTSHHTKYNRSNKKNIESYSKIHKKFRSQFHIQFLLVLDFMFLRFDFLGIGINQETRQRFCINKELHQLFLIFFDLNSSTLKKFRNKKVKKC